MIAKKTSSYLVILVVVVFSFVLLALITTPAVHAATAPQAKQSFLQNIGNFFLHPKLFFQKIKVTFNTNRAAETPDFSISNDYSVSPLTVSPGIATIRIRVSCLNGYTGSISGFSVSGLQAGATASFNPTSANCNNQAFITDLTINTVSATESGQKDLTVSATGAGDLGVRQTTIKFNLTGIGSGVCITDRCSNIYNNCRATNIQYSEGYPACTVSSASYVYDTACSCQGKDGCIDGVTARICAKPTPTTLIPPPLTCVDVDFNCDGRVTLTDVDPIANLWRSGTSVNINLVTSLGLQCKILGTYIGNLWRNGYVEVPIDEVTRVGAKVKECLPSPPINHNPSDPIITGDNNVESGTSHTYSAVSTDPDGDNLSYTFNWGDGTTTERPNNSSGSSVSIAHVWNPPSAKNYTLKVTVRDGKDGLASNTYLVSVSPAPIPAPSISVLTPKGGEVIQTGSGNYAVTYRITNYQSLANPAVDFELVQNGITLGKMVPNLVGTYPDQIYWNFNWQIGLYYKDNRTIAQHATGSGFKIRVLLYNDSSDSKPIASDESDGTFSIVGTTTVHQIPQVQNLVATVSNTSSGYQSVNLTWSPVSVNGLDIYYNIYKSSQSGFSINSSNIVNYVAINTPSYTDTDARVKPGDIFYYRVNAQDGKYALSGLVGPASTEVRVVIPSPPPPPAQSACYLDWKSPKLADGKGVRQAGDTANVAVRLTGFTPGARVRLRNNSATITDKQIRNIGSPITIGADGTYSYTDQTIIKASEYPAGFYNTWVVDENNQQLNTALAACDHGFQIVASAPTETTEILPPPPSIPPPPPIVDTIRPSINSFDVQPRSTTGSVTISWSVSDTGGSHLSRVEINHANGNSTNCNGNNWSGCNWQQLTSVLAPSGSDSWTFSISDSPRAGSYLYGLHVLDGANNRTIENAPIGVVIVPPPTIANSSSCLGIKAPANVNAGQQFDVTVSMKNTGSNDWDSDNYFLGSQDPQDNTVWGLHRVALPSSKVSFDQKADFTFKVTAPSVPNGDVILPFDWRMVQERVMWFGDYCRTNIDVRGAPPVAGTFNWNGKFDFHDVYSSSTPWDPKELYFDAVVTNISVDMSQIPKGSVIDLFVGTTRSKEPSYPFVIDFDNMHVTRQATGGGWQTSVDLSDTPVLLPKNSAVICQASMYNGDKKDHEKAIQSCRVSYKPYVLGEARYKALRLPYVDMGSNSDGSTPAARYQSSSVFPLHIKKLLLFQSFGGDNSLASADPCLRWFKPNGNLVKEICMPTQTISPSQDYDSSRAGLTLDWVLPVGDYIEETCNNSRANTDCSLIAMAEIPPTLKLGPENTFRFYNNVSADHLSDYCRRYAPSFQNPFFCGGEASCSAQTKIDNCQTLAPNASCVATNSCANQVSEGIGQAGFFANILGIVRNIFK